MTPSTPQEYKKAADEGLLEALTEIGFYKNIWKFDPKYVRYLLKYITLFFGVMFVAALFVLRTRFGSYKYVFLSFGSLTAVLFWYWYNTVECGGGSFIFSPEWQDSFVRSWASETNYIVKVTVGYEYEVKASIAYTSFEFNKDDSVDVAWLADEIEQQFPMDQLTRRK